MDPRTNWSGRDWMIASVYFNMLKCLPPGEHFAHFYAYTIKHKPVTFARIMKTIGHIAKYKQVNITRQDKCIARKILKLWKMGFKIKNKNSD